MLRKGRSRQGPGEFVDGEWRMQPRRPTRPRVSSCLFCFRPFLFESSISRSLSGVFNLSQAEPCNPSEPSIPHYQSSQPSNICSSTTNVDFKRPLSQLIQTTMSSSPNDPKHQEIYNKLASQDTAPLPLKKVLAKEQADYDCLSCRVMGKIFLLCTSKELSFTDLS